MSFLMKLVIATLLEEVKRAFVIGRTYRKGDIIRHGHQPIAQLLSDPSELGSQPQLASLPRDMFSWEIMEMAVREVVERLYNASECVENGETGENDQFRMGRVSMVDVNCGGYHYAGACGTMLAGNYIVLVEASPPPSARAPLGPLVSLGGPHTLFRQGCRLYWASCLWLVDRRPFTPDPDFARRVRQNLGGWTDDALR